MAYDDIPDSMRELLLSMRQSHIIMIGAIEEYLGMERTKPPNRKGKRENSGSGTLPREHNLQRGGV